MHRYQCKKSRINITKKINMIPAKEMNKALTTDTKEMKKYELLNNLE